MATLQKFNLFADVWLLNCMVQEFRFSLLFILVPQGRIDPLSYGNTKIKLTGLWRDCTVPRCSLSRKWKKRRAVSVTRTSSVKEVLGASTGEPWGQERWVRGTGMENLPELTSGVSDLHWCFWDVKVVAIKKMDLPPVKEAEGEREFRVEVDILSRLDHPNLVSLIGYCADGKHRFLVYEYMQKGNLQDHLNGNLVPRGRKSLI